MKDLILLAILVYFYVGYLIKMINDDEETPAMTYLIFWPIILIVIAVRGFIGYLK